MCKEPTVQMVFNYKLKCKSVEHADTTNSALLTVDWGGVW